MKKKVAVCIVTAVMLAMLATSAFAGIAYDHDAGTPDCRLHSMCKTCWGETTHIYTDGDREDAPGYTRARFESVLSITADTLRNYGIGYSYADTNSDSDIEGGHGCVYIDSGYVGHTYYGSDEARLSSGRTSGAVAYKVNAETGKTTVIQGGEN